MQYIDHHCCINIDQMMSSYKVVNRVNSCSIILWYLLFLLFTDLVLDELMHSEWSVSLQILLLLWWYLTDCTLLIHLDICNQYLFLIVYHEVCYHRMTLTALTVCTNYIKFIFDSGSDCCLLLVEKLRTCGHELDLQSSIMNRAICQTLDLMLSSSFSITERKSRRTKSGCDWARLVCQFRFSIVKYISQADRSPWCWVRMVLSVNINNDTTVAPFESFFCVCHHQSSVCNSL